MNDINTAFLKPQAMPDIQSSHDERALPIEQVGIRGLRHPLSIRTQTGVMPAVGNFEMAGGRPIPMAPSSTMPIKRKLMS
jgi:GTP cyclohydrolase I